MVNLTRIYTRTGDAGETRLSDNSVARKTDLRVQAYGEVDEANSAIGVALAHGTLPEPVVAALGIIQNELFDLGADLSNPLVAQPEWEPLRIIQPSIDRLEAWCDEFGESLPKLRSFILPGGTPAAAQLHVCRTIVRRAERTAWLVAEQYGTEVSEDPEQVPGGVNPLAIKYLNRLSDLLFIMSRAANGDAEVLWVPGGERNPSAAEEG
ncbi:MULTISPECIES: cob(I)yrinic acid a,c-diamide adenosyltransferase [unclassified Luteococcus]|uniref:cob(I)yrinic acid a,c-diamide adenosyltransferase n=1 Tax=unclassified Luteococcus TaxID=2639923 RepID=UPI00313C0D95